MTEIRRCMFCKFYDDTGGVPTCRLLKKFTRPEWSCNGFEGTVNAASEE